jgi:hypothetical protein
MKDKTLIVKRKMSGAMSEYIPYAIKQLYLAVLLHLKPYAQ